MERYSKEYYARRNNLEQAILFCISLLKRTSPGFRSAGCGKRFWDEFETNEPGNAVLMNNGKLCYDEKNSYCSLKNYIMMDAAFHARINEIGYSDAQITELSNALYNHITDYIV